jgi:hypothetical protein
MGTGQGDFDFFFGTWTVRHRRLVGRLVGSQTWQEFEGQCTCWPLMNGQGNVDDNLVGLPEGAYRAVTLRSFDPGKGLWSIWWLDGRNPHALDVPVVGRFEKGEGVFFADDSLNGKPITVRFLWWRTADGLPQWEQAFSPDSGKSWEVNWTMVFHPRS